MIGWRCLPHGEKTEAEVAAIDRRTRAFRLADLQSEWPWVGIDFIRQVLAPLLASVRNPYPSTALVTLFRRSCLPVQHYREPLEGCALAGGVPKPAEPISNVSNMVVPWVGKSEVVGATVSPTIESAGRT